jgi:hypothetical protein
MKGTSVYGVIPISKKLMRYLGIEGANGWTELQCRVVTAKECRGLVIKQLSIEEEELARGQKGFFLRGYQGLAGTVRC